MENDITENSTARDVVKGFIVGMSRSGTTWLAKSLDRHPELAVIGETAFWGREYVEPNKDGYYMPSQQGEIIKRLQACGLTATMGNISDTETKESRHARHARRRAVVGKLMEQCQIPVMPDKFFTQICGVVVDDEGKKWAIEKTPHHVNWLERITSEYPQARFLVMFRDAYGFMLSYKHQDERKQLDAGRKFKNLYHPLGCALVWRGYAMAIANALQKYPEHCMSIEYGQLKSEPTKVIERAQKFIGVRVVDGLVIPPDNSSFVNRARPELDAIDIFWMNLVAKNRMKELAIEQKDGNASIFQVIASVVRIPVWVITVLTRFLIDGRIKSIAYLLTWVRNKT